MDPIWVVNNKLWRHIFPPSFSLGFYVKQLSLKILMSISLWFKLRCNNRFRRAFTACICIFKVITLVWGNQYNYFENATTCSERTLKTRVAMQLVLWLILCKKTSFKVKLRSICSEPFDFTLTLKVDTENKNTHLDLGN